MKLQGIKLIVGLGNLGKQYAQTYHNAGFLFIEYIINKNPAKIKNQKSKIKNFEFIKIDDFTLVKPLTFMNESGKTVKNTLNYFKAKPEEILIAHDDSDINLGDYKLSFGRGSAGHNGVESIIKDLKTKNFWRLRIGIRPLVRVSSRLNASEIVLKKISKKDLEILKKVFEKISTDIIL